MKIKRFALFMATAFAAFQMASAQSYFDDDIYYDASKDKAAKTVKKSSGTTQNSNYRKAATYANDSLSLPPTQSTAHVP